MSEHETPGPWHYLHRIDELGVPGALEHADGRVLGLGWESDEEGLLAYLNALESRVNQLEQALREAREAGMSILAEAILDLEREMEQCKAEIQVDSENIWRCVQDKGHKGDHVSANPNVRWSKDVISAPVRLNVLAAERDRYKAALVRIRSGADAAQHIAVEALREAGDD